MNAERLHIIAKAVLDELSQSTIVQQLQQLTSHLQNMVNQPQQPQHQQQMSAVLQNLFGALAKAPSNEFSPAWKQVLDEIGLGQYVGEQLRKRIQDIFERNQITPSVALQDITKLHQNLSELQQALANLSGAFSKLGIGIEPLEAGECELGVIVPRSYVEDDLKNFGKELEKIDGILGSFAELGSGNREGFKIRTISSSDLSVYLDIAPKVGACVAVAVERIVTLYKGLLEIRKLRGEMQQQGVPESALTGIERHAHDQMKEGIEALADELIDSYYLNEDKNRKNELRTELKKACGKIASRIDRGFNIEIRVEPFESDESETEEGQDTEGGDHIQTILGASKKIQFMKMEGEPLLGLPEEDSPDE